MELIKHPESDETVRGYVLKPGSTLKRTDLYSSSTGQWLPNPVGAAKAIDNGVVWVRPVSEADEEDYQQERRERNRLVDPRCKCEKGRLTSGGVSIGPIRVFYSNGCPLKHEPLFWDLFTKLDEVNELWPHKNEPPEMKYPDGIPAQTT